MESPHPPFVTPLGTTAGLIIIVQSLFLSPDPPLSGQAAPSCANKGPRWDIPHHYVKAIKSRHPETPTNIFPKMKLKTTRKNAKPHSIGQEYVRSRRGGWRVAGSLWAAG